MGGGSNILELLEGIILLEFLLTYFQSLLALIWVTGKFYENIPLKAT